MADDQLRQIVSRMVAAGESEQSIASVIQRYSSSRQAQPAPTQPEPSMWERVMGYADAAVPTVLRVGGGIGGAIAGGLAAGPSIVGVPAGVIAGGAAGSALGEAAAQKYEGRDLNPTQIATQGALGAIPFVGKAGSVAKTAASRAAQGGLLGGAGSVATDLAEGETPSLGRAAVGTVLGAGLGAGAGTLEARAVARRAPRPAVVPEPPVHAATVDAPPQVAKADPLPAQPELPVAGKPPTPVNTPEQTALAKLDALAEAQLAPAKLPGVRDQATVTAFEARRRLVNQFAAVEDYLRAAGLDPLAEPAATNPVKAIDLAHGGTPGKVERAADLYKSVYDEAQKAGVDDALLAHLNLNALEAGAETLARRAPEALEAGKALPMGITPEDLRFARAAWEAQPVEQRQVVEQLAKRVFALNEEVLDRVHAAGLIRPEVYQELKARAAKAADTGIGGYAPLNRVLEEIGIDPVTYTKSGMNMPTQHVLFRLEGSEKVTKHPLVTSLERTAVAISEAEKNKALRTLVDLPENYAQNPLFTSTIVKLEGDAKPPQGFDTISLFVQGERVNYAVPELVAQAVKQMDPQSTNTLMRTLLRAVGGTFRAGTTVRNLAFSIPNIARDVSDLQQLEQHLGKLTAKEGVTKQIPYLPVAKDWAEALVHVIRQSPKYLEFLDSGAAFSTFQKSMKDTRELLHILPPKNGPMRAAGRVFMAPLDASKWFNNAVEEATKLAAFTRQRRAGMGLEDAAWQTRRFGGSPDFARRGSDVAQYNDFIPFLNAQIQGIARIPSYVKRHPGAAVGALAGITGQMLLLQQYNNSYRDPDGIRSWDRITDVEKQDNWIIFLPWRFEHEGVVRQDYLKIPAGHTVNLFRAPIAAMLDPKRRSVSGVADAVVQQMPTSPDLDASSPGALLKTSLKSGVSALNPLLKVPIEQGMNEDTFRRVPIVPRRFENVEAPEQYTDTTSPAAKALGRAIGGSPLRIQHGIKGAFGGVGEQALSIADAAADPSKIAKKPPVIGPIARRFVGSIDPRVDQVERDRNNLFYTTRQDAARVRSTVAALKKRGDEAAVEKYLANPEHQRLYMLAPSLERVAVQINRLRTAQDVEGERELLKEVADYIAQATK